MERREFLKLIGVAGAGLGTFGCTTKPAEKLIPYLIPPEEIVPGVPTWYASVCRECPAGCGLLVKTREGRAVKLEGNPHHPVNAGKLCARGQAALQGLYNPDRIRGPMKKSEAGDWVSISWAEAERLLVEKLRPLRQQGLGQRIVFLTGHLTGSLDRLVDEWLASLGSARRVIYEPYAYEPIQEANRLTFGLKAIPTYDIQKANYLLSFGADFLETWVSPLLYARQFGKMHSYRDGSMGTFIHVEPRLSLTASNADEWIAPKPGTEMFVALSLAHVILREGSGVRLSREEAGRLKRWLADYTPERAAELTGVPAARLEALARDFAQLRPSLALGGGVATTHAAATATWVAVNLLNYVAGNVGETVRFGPTANLWRVAPFRELLDLKATMENGGVSLLLIHQANPAFTLPRALGFENALARVSFKVSFSSYLDETTALADLVLPDHHALESWGDHVPLEGVHGLMQPVMPPVFETRALGDVLLSVARVLGLADRFPWPTFLDYLRQGWQDLHHRVAPRMRFEDFWAQALQQGGVWYEVPPRPVRLSPEVFTVSFSAPTFAGDEEGLYLLASPTSTFFDGRSANRPWLQELPDPVTGIMWHSWIEIHPSTAEALGIKEGDILTVESPAGRIEAPAYLYPGLHPEVVALPIGQGHWEYGRYAKGRGSSPLELLPPAEEALSGGLAWFSTKVRLTKTGRNRSVIKAQGSEAQAGREIARVVNLVEARALEAEHPAEGLELVRAARDSAPESPYRWGMAIDLSSCIGCGACVTACYAENNVPVVGEAQCERGREMAWIRVERFLEESPEGKVGVRHLPMLCQHCGAAPCEPVCPVFATYHNPEGLNVQVYNRCVGTRYCANNCPYKVRKFNWFTYEHPEPLHLLLNPDVTVREKGVMEKCTFCVQRINSAKREARAEGRLVRDGEIVPACAQACPTEAIVFGNLKDPHSEVSRRSRSARGYHVLEELNTRSAITYLMRVERTS